MRKIWAALAAIILGTIGTLFVASPAAASWSQCYAGDFCLWTGQNASGSFYSWSRNTIAAQDGVTLSSGINNVSDSWWNRTGGNIDIFDNGDCGYGGWDRRMVNGQQATSQGSDWGSRVSSIAIPGDIYYPC
jgi:hypothetical protein